MSQSLSRRVVNRILQIPTINDGLNDFDRLFQLWEQVSDDFSDVTLDFSRCYFLRQNAVAFLGGLVRLIESRCGKVTFDWNSLPNHVGMNLRQNGFMCAFSNGEEPWQGNSIPYREDQHQDKDGLVSYLKQNWLGRGWLQVSQPLQNVIVGTVWEIYANAFEHSCSKIGVVSCGQHYPRCRELKLTVIDFGVGIPCNVRIFQKNINLPAAEALEWAFQQGTTTRPCGVTGGVGLDLLKNFVKFNKGRLEIFSHDGYVLIDENQVKYLNRQSFFEGTLINITLQCNESYYQLAYEADDEPLF